MTTRVQRTDVFHLDPIAAVKADWKRRDAGEACESCGAPIGPDGKHAAPKAGPAPKTDARGKPLDVFEQMKREQERDGIR